LGDSETKIKMAYFIAQPQRLAGEILESHKTNQSESPLNQELHLYEAGLPRTVL